jgi:hypothetical protein
MEFRLRRMCIDGLLGGQVQVTMSYETCCVLFLSSASSLPFWAWLFPAEIPPICYFPEYLFCPRLERMMEGSRSLVFASSVPVFLPCPFSDFSSFPCYWGTGDLWHCSVSCVMEWNISLAIFLATKRVLSLEAIFSVFWLLASTGWRKTILISVRSTGPRPLVLASACCYRAGLLGRGPLGGSGMSTLAQPRWASFI